MKDILKKPIAWLAIAFTVALSYFCAGYIRGREANTASNQSYISGDAGVVPPSLQTFAGCAATAAGAYQVPPEVLTRIMIVEGGHVGQAVADANGTYDLGIMQINTVWVPELARIWRVDYATAYQAVRDNGCENIYVGAWILKQKIVQTGQLYDGIAYYHSARQPGAAYADKVTTGTTFFHH